MKNAFFYSSQFHLPFPVCRFGLATRGGSHLTTVDIHYAIDRGINFLNWCGQPDALSQAISELQGRRQEFMVCVQLEARSAYDAKRELGSILHELRTDYVDVLTFYYIEHPGEWEEIIAPQGALSYCRQAQRDGKVRLLGLTSHQRRLAAEIARSGMIDLLMIRYNAAHRGSEQDIFPTTEALAMPVVAFTCLRWGALLEPTPDDPPGFALPKAPAWYRFVLQSSSVAVALMAPDNRAELEEDLTVLEAAGPLPAEEFDRLAAHGQRVRRHGGTFP